MNEPVSQTEVAVTINGHKKRATVEARCSLADFLRAEGFTGTHVGCEHGVCGACTIMFNGIPTRSCLILAVQAHNADITTIEGLGGASLHPLQDAFRTHHALQCGFCTPGMIISALALLAENPKPTESDVREALSGNLCRCTGYQFIVDAVIAAASKLQVKQT